MDESVEIWRDVVGYEGLYQVSSMGRVKSLSREMINGRNFFISKDRILKPCVDTTGYYTLNLWKDRRPHTSKVHKLVAIAFLGHYPCGQGTVLDHINGDKLDNRLTNLQMVTSRQNSTICFRKGRDTLTSKYVGVSWDKRSRKWDTGIRIEGKYTHLGRYSSEIDASNAYQSALSNFLNKKDKD